MNLIKIFKNISYYIVVFFGLFLILVMLYIRFVRERLPKTIPFTLTEYTFWALVIICLLYSYLIIRLLYPRNPHPSIVYIITISTKPFVYLDTFIKYNKYVYPIYVNLFFNLCNYLSFKASQYNCIVIHLFQIIPRIMLLTIFVVDIFYFHYIQIFYYFLLLSIVPLFYAYVKYSLELALETYTQQLETLYKEISILEKGYFFFKDAYLSSNPQDALEDSENQTLDDFFGVHNPKAIYHDIRASIREYIEIQFETKLNNDSKDETTHFEYAGLPICNTEIRNEYIKKHNIKGDNLTDKDVLDEAFNRLCQKY